METNRRRLHVRSPRAILAIGIAASLLIPIAAFASGSGPSYALLVSKSPSRSSAVSLSGSDLSGSVFIFLSPMQGVNQASFWLDNAAMTGKPTHIEGSQPFDFAGTDTAGKAKPWDAEANGKGKHAISVKIETSSGTLNLTTAFTVDMSGPGGSANPTPTGKATPTPQPKSTPTQPSGPTPTPVHGGPHVLPAGFLGRSGTNLIVAGQSVHFTGFNIYQANSRSNCSYTMGTGSRLDAALTDIGPGADVFRAWFFQNLATTGGKRDWSAFDHTLAVARAHGVRVIATLGNQWGSCDGGGYRWASWYTGGYADTVSAGSIVSYRQFVAEVVARYKDDPTIAMWQLMNEAEIKKDGTSTCAPATDLFNFAADVSGLIKSIDPNHLVSLGTMGGGQCGSQGTDYKLINSPSTIDVCEFHDYGHETQAVPANLSRDIAFCDALNKPIFVGEAGIKVGSVGGTLASRAAAFNAKVTAMFAAGVKGFVIWSWNNAPSAGSWQVGPGDPTVSVMTGN
jgi:hypothetical protein